MDFTKYVAMLSSGGLYFARGRTLREIDPLEGSLPQGTIAVMRTRNELPGTPQGLIRFIDTVNEQIRSENLDSVLVNCWHMSDHESAAMWKVYTASPFGVAIQSTFQRLWDCLDGGTYIGAVQYIDFDSDVIEYDHEFVAFMHKRHVFRHEKEIRALKFERRITPTTARGRTVNVDLSALILGVYVSPGAPDWYLDVVSATTTTFGYKFPVQASRMDATPLW